MTRKQLHLSPSSLIYDIKSPFKIGVVLHSNGQVQIVLL